MPLAVLLLATAAAVAPAQSELGLAVSMPDLAAPVAAISVDLDVGDERALGDGGAMRWRLGAGGSLVPSDRSISGSASAGLDASWSVGGWTFLGRLSANASTSTIDGIGPLAAAVGASFVHDGELASVSLEPLLAVQALVDPYTDLGISIKVAVLAGSAVLEPALAAGVRWDTDTEVRLEPGLAVSWYPGIPLTIKTGLRWTARVASDGGWTSAWTATIVAAGALGGVMLFTGTGSIGSGADEIVGDAAAELAVVLGEAGGVEVSLPIRCSVTSSDAGGITAGLGGGLRFSW
jgi:hypothetical protein